MTNDSKLFPPRWKWEEQGYRADEYGHWLKGNWAPYSGERSILRRPRGLVLSADGAAGILVGDVEDVALPLYQGAMINQLDFCASGYRRIEGKRGFKWASLAGQEKVVEPQFLMSRRDYLSTEGVTLGAKLGYRRIARTSDTRTFICADLPSVPCGDAVFLLSSARSEAGVLAGVFSSFTFDWLTRQRLGGTNLSYSIIADIPLLSPKAAKPLELISAQLSWPHIGFAGQWLGVERNAAWRTLWAVSAAERLRLRVMVEAMTAYAFGLTESDVGVVTEECDYPSDRLKTGEFVRSLNPKGFWRYEKDLAPELRLAVLSQIAFRDLVKRGLQGFVEQNEGQGWMLPVTLRLADYGLGHDDRAKEHQLVAAALGPRFYPWQTEQAVDESWAECELHATVLEELVPKPAPKEQPGEDGGDVPVDLFGVPLEMDLFGNPVYPVKGRTR